MRYRPTHEYVLGTHDAERDRLASQHELWIDEMRHAWRAAGITRGTRVLDLGCGPGLVMESLLAEVGAEGRVAGLEIAPDFVQQSQQRAAARGRADTDIRVFDLMHAPLPADMHGQFDAVWCRWVAMFVRDPPCWCEPCATRSHPEVALHSTSMCITKPMRFIRTDRAWRSLYSWL
jgi:SAM-dependent methyltransferase